MRINVVVTFSCFVVLLADTRVQMKDLPEPVQKTVREQTRNAKLRGLSKEVDHGKTFYEAETTVEGRSRDILIDASGAIVEVEEVTDLENIPAAARKTIEALAGSGKIVKLETITQGSVVSYEAVVEKGGKKSEVAVDADGSLKRK